DAPERGFVMAFDALFRGDEDDAVFVLGVDGDGRACGFLHFAVCPAGSALSLSSMPRTADVPNGFTEWLICESIEWARAHGFAHVSLNFSPFAALLSPEVELSFAQRLQAATLRRMKPWFQLDNLLLFNRKFFPSWQRRFVVYERRRDLRRLHAPALLGLATSSADASPARALAGAAVPERALGRRVLRRHRRLGSLRRRLAVGAARARPGGLGGRHRRPGDRRPPAASRRARWCRRGARRARAACVLRRRASADGPRGRRGRLDLGRRVGRGRGRAGGVALVRGR